MSENESYYRRRIEQELTAAERASEPAAAQIHRDMAQRYRHLLASSSINGNDMRAPLAGGQIVASGTYSG